MYRAPSIFIGRPLKDILSRKNKMRPFIQGSKHLQQADYSTVATDSKESYHFIGFGLVPGFSFGKKVRFFGAIGHLLEYSRIQPVSSTVTTNYYDYHQNGVLQHVHEEISQQTTSVSSEGGGEDHWWLFQGGVHFNLDAHFTLQPSVCYRLSAGLSSVQVPLKYTRSDVAASVMLLYRWGNKRRNVKGG
jgi:hypothetical protein